MFSFFFSFLLSFGLRYQLICFPRRKDTQGTGATECGNVYVYVCVHGCVIASTFLLCRQSDYGSHLKAMPRESDWVFTGGLLKGVEVSLHEALSLQLQHFQRLADAHLKQTGQFKQPVTHTVLVVPNDFTQAQREVYSQLAQAAELTVVSRTHNKASSLYT